MIGIIDYGSGNTGSIHNLLRKLGYPSINVGNEEQLSGCCAIILPGVGHYDQAVREIKRIGLWEPIKNFVISDSKPYLGICLGMQLIGNRSDEGDLDGFGWLDVSAVKLNADDSFGLKSPNMGWRVPRVLRTDSLIQKTNGISPKFYFAHSYALVGEKKDYVLATSEFGNQEFICAVQKNNIFGVQFHPEKSHNYGLNLMSNFVSHAYSTASKAIS
jgi:glutamine amidotransferase